MNRRTFLSGLLALPILKKIIPQTTPKAVGQLGVWRGVTIYDHEQAAREALVDWASKREASLFNAVSGPPGSNALIWTHDTIDAHIDPEGNVIAQAHADIEEVKVHGQLYKVGE